MNTNANVILLQTLATFYGTKVWKNMLFFVCHGDKGMDVELDLKYWLLSLFC
jgi:hypothetical protein